MGHNHSYYAKYTASLKLFYVVKRLPSIETFEKLAFFYTNLFFDDIKRVFLPLQSLSFEVFAINSAFISIDMINGVDLHRSIV